MGFREPVAVQRGLLPSPSLNLWSCGWNRTQGTQGVGVCTNHDIFVASGSTSFYLCLRPLQSGVLTPSLRPHRGGSPGTYSVRACGGFASAWRRLSSLGGRWAQRTARARKRRRMLFIPWFSICEFKLTGEASRCEFFIAISSPCLSAPRAAVCWLAGFIAGKVRNLINKVRSGVGRCGRLGCWFLLTLER